MLWALSHQDPDNWYQARSDEQRQQIDLLIDHCDNDFKPWLDKYKYAVRFPEYSEADYRAHAEVFLQRLEARLQQQPYLMDDQITLADMAIFPFIRQFAGVDRDWFDQSPYQEVKHWLDLHLASARFKAVMKKYPLWQAHD